MKKFLCLISFLFLFSKSVMATVYYPSGESLLNSTVSISGTTTALVADDVDYRTLRSYASTYAADYQSTAVDIGSSWNTNTTYQDKTVLTWTVPVADNYLILATGEIKRSSTTALRTGKAQMTIDGTGYGEQFVTDDTDVDSYRTFVAVKIINLSAASHTIKIQYGTTNTLNLGSIKNARIMAFRIGSSYQAHEPANSTTASTSYVNVGTLSFTPDNTQDWMVIGQAEVTNSSTSNISSVNLLVGTSQMAESALRVVYATHYLPASAWKRVNLAAGVGITMNTQIKASAGTTTYRNVRLYAIPESIFSATYQAANTGETSCGTCTTASPLTVQNLNFTPVANGDFMLIGNGEIRNNSVSVYSAARLSIGDTLLGDSLVDVGTTAHRASFTIHKVVNLTNSSKDLTAKLYVQSTGTTVWMRNVSLMAIAMPPASKQTMQVEYNGTSDTNTWTSLTWKLVSSFSKASVGTTIQLYNYNTASYPNSGDGFLSFTSNGTANTEETKTQTISTNPTYYRDGSGNWKMKISAYQDATDWFQFSGDLLEYDALFPVVSVTVSDGVVNFGNLNIGASRSTLISGTNDTQYVTNAGNVTESFNIKGQNTVCPWTLAGSPGTDIYSQLFSTNSGVGWTALSTSYGSLINNISVGSTFPLDLLFKSPTNTNCTSSQSVDVTIQAFQP